MTKLQKHSIFLAVRPLLAVLMTALAAAAQTPGAPQPLPAAQTLDREMTGAQTHRYRLSLKKGEFLQVRVEQKGIDVTLRLLDVGGAVVATMDSPNGAEGPETLSFVASQAGAYTLVVSGFDVKAEKYAYTIRREATRTATAQDRRRVEVERAFVEGLIARSKEGQKEVAVKKLKEALAGWEELKDDYLKELTARQLKQVVPLPPESAAVFQELRNDLATGQKTLSEAQVLMTKSKADSLAAREKAETALSVFRLLSAKAADAATVEKIRSSGETAEELVKNLKQFQFFAKAGIGLSLNAISQTHFNLGEWQKHIEYLSRAAAVYEEIPSDENFTATPELRNQALAFRPLGAGIFVMIAQTLDQRLGQTEGAVGYMIRGLEAYRALYEETRDPQYRRQEAMILVNLGVIYGKMSKDKKKAVESITAGVDIYRMLPDRQDDVAAGLLQMANYQFLDLDYQAALNSANRGLEIYRALDDRQGQSNALHYLGMMYYTLGDQPKVREHFGRIISLLESPGFNENHKQKRYAFINTGTWHEKIDAFIEERRLTAIASAYRFLEEYQKSIKYYEKALPLARASAEPASIRLTLGALGFSHAKLEEWGKAVEFYRQALEISRTGSEQETIADDLKDLGWALLEAGRPRDALKYQDEALLLYRAVGIGRDGAFTISLSSLLNELGRSHYALGDRRLAIFYGKQGVNAIQSERQRLQSLDAASQKGFLEKKEKHYRRLADWLIEEGRLPEAEQVLAMLKQEEYAGLLRRSDGEPSSVGYSPAEAETVKIIAQLAELGRERSELAALLDKKALDEAGRKRLNQIDFDLLPKANAEFTRTLDVISREAPKKAVETAEVADAQALMGQLRKMGPGTVALYTIISTEPGKAAKGWVMLVAPQGNIRKAYEMDVSGLERTVLELRSALRTPTADPRPAAHKLYRMIFQASQPKGGPTLEADLETYLKRQKERTLMWSLDGVLRYVPMAALSPDGEHFLVERFRNIVFTPASVKVGLNGNVSRKWTALGLGVSKGHRLTDEATKETITFAELKGVPLELSAIVREPGRNGAGVLPGVAKLDEQFDRDAMLDGLRAGFPVVHIASHFHYRPADPNRSFLLLGDGGRLEMSAFNNAPPFFEETELLTLSACDTAVGSGGEANGKDAEGLGFVAQRLGAQAVIGSLWPVDDVGTQVLMPEFYRLRQTGLSKAEALRQAQLRLLRGGKQDALSNSRAEMAGSPPPAAGSTPYKPAPQRPYAHPYYWAPFILIGNWK